MLALNYALAGLALGAVAALSGVGVLATYRATGVFNFAHGAIAMLAAYLFYELVQVGVPRVLAALVVLLLAAPLLGLGLERVVFRPLQRRRASPAESLVATIGLQVLFLAVAILVWGGQARPAPSLLPRSPLHLGSLTLHLDAVIELLIIAAGSVAAALVGRRTTIGTRIRAVVDRRDLAELAGVDANQVAAIGWAIGAVIAALTGILLAPQLSLTPLVLTLVVLETFAIPVVAGLSSVPIALATGLALGIGTSEINLAPPTGIAADFVNALQPNLPVVLLLGGLLLRNRLATTGDSDTGSAATLARRRSTEPSARRQAVLYTGAAVALFLPLSFSSENLRLAQEVPAYGIIFVSIVAVTGFSGQISLGQAGYAGIGALFAARVSGDAPELVALLVGVIAAGLVGFVTGYPAIRRRGLFLALTTFAVGTFLYEFVFSQPYFVTGLHARRPNLFGLSLAGDRAFYLFELAMLAVTFLISYNLQSGPLGRSLIAMRDSEDGARSVGVDVRSLKVFIFTVSAALAGLGGALLVQQAGAFSPDTQFEPLGNSLAWFAVVVVFGADSAAGAIVGAAFIVLLDVVTAQADAYQVVIGALAAFIGLLPGGAAEGARRLTDWLITPTQLMRRYAASVPPPRPEPVLSPAGRAALDDVRRAAAGAGSTP